MALRVVTARPALESFTTLSEHQSQTPGTFFDSKPVLYHSCRNAEVLIAHDEIHLSDSVSRLVGASSNDGVSNGDGAHQAKIAVQNIDVFVSSEELILYNSAHEVGTAIPYRSIALHAIQTLESAGLEALYMQLSLNDTSLVNSEDEYQMLELSVVPADHEDSELPTTSPSLDAPGTSARSGSNSRTPARLLFKAISECADLHPDPEEGEEEEEDLAPGAGGWITAENADQYFDEDGQFVGQQFLGPGAGTIRTREADDVEDDAESATDLGPAAADTKWRRTD